MLTVLVMLASILGHSVVPVEAWTGTVYIRADGSVDPLSAPILRFGDLYTLTDNIYGSGGGIVVQRSNIVVDGAGYTVQGSGEAYNSIGVDLSGISNVTIRNMKITAFGYGVRIDSSSFNRILGNNITNNKNGAIMFSDSSFNNISGNDIVNNGYWCVNLQDSSSNSISGNNITNNDKYGIHLNLCSSNSILGNDIAGAEYGISIEAYSSFNSIIGNTMRNCRYRSIFIWAYSNSNIIYHNNILDNGVTASDVVNVWDDSYPSGGNYWSDYKGTDMYSGPYQNISGSDGIGDTPYIISTNNTDRYPLTGLWTAPSSKPRAFVSIRSSVYAFKLNDEVLLTTSIYPATSNGTITYQCSKDGGDWTILASGKPSNGSYSSKWIPSTVASQYQVRVVWSGDEVYSNTTSIVLTFNHLTVSSAYGTPVGDAWYRHGAEVDFSIPSIVDHGNGTRRVFTGWTGDLNVTNAAWYITMDSPKTVVANWRNQYYLKVVSEYGEPKGEAWYDEGATASFSVTSPVGLLVQHVFDRWSGDSTAASTIASLTMNSAKTVTAKWTTDYTQLMALVAGIVIVGGATIFALKRKKKTHD